MAQHAPVARPSTSVPQWKEERACKTQPETRLNSPTKQSSSKYLLPRFESTQYMLPVPAAGLLKDGPDHFSSPRCQHRQKRVAQLIDVSLFLGHGPVVEGNLPHASSRSNLAATHLHPH